MAYTYILCLRTLDQPWIWLSNGTYAYDYSRSADPTPWSIPVHAGRARTHPDTRTHARTRDFSMGKSFHSSIPFLFDEYICKASRLEFPATENVEDKLSSMQSKIP